MWGLILHLAYIWANGVCWLDFVNVLFQKSDHCHAPQSQSTLPPGGKHVYRESCSLTEHMAADLSHFFTKTICCEVNVDCTVERLEDNYTSPRWNWLNFVFLSAIGHKISQENEGWVAAGYLFSLRYGLNDWINFVSKSADYFLD